MTQSFGASLGTYNAGKLAQVSARFVNQDGTYNGAAITTATAGATLTESGNGFYLLQVTPPIVQGAIRWFLTGVMVAEEAVNPDPRLANLDVPVSTRGTIGVGGTLVERTLRHAVTGSPLDGVTAWVTTDPANDHTNVVASDISGRARNGVVQFRLDPGTYYLWAQLDGFNTPTVVDTILVS